MVEMMSLITSLPEIRRRRRSPQTYEVKQGFLH